MIIGEANDKYIFKRELKSNKDKTELKSGICMYEQNEKNTFYTHPEKHGPQWDAPISAEGTRRSDCHTALYCL